MSLQISELVENIVTNCRKNANSLAGLIDQFENKPKIRKDLIRAYEQIFSEFLKNKEMCLDPNEKANNAVKELKTWLLECYDLCWKQITNSFEDESLSSQAFVTAINMLRLEGQNPIDTKTSPMYIPSDKLEKMFTAFLHSEKSMINVIDKFEEYSEYLDILQNSIKVLATIPHKKDVSTVYILNYLELLDKLVKSDIKQKLKQKSDEEKNINFITSEKYLFSFDKYKKAINKAWSLAIQWPLCKNPKTHKKALLLLIEKVMPYLSKPELASDMLMDSLDSGRIFSTLALQGLLELMRRHNIDYPDIYDRLYAMLETEYFTTANNKRLIYLIDVFLSSTHLPEALIIAFAKRLARLALVSPSEDAITILQLIENLIFRNAEVKKNTCNDHSNVVMSRDPYVSDEPSPTASFATQSYLWEISALRSHACPILSTIADRLLSNLCSLQTKPIETNIEGDLFEAEIKKRFASIEVNFSRPDTMALPTGERLGHYWSFE